MKKNTKNSKSSIIVRFKILNQAPLINYHASYTVWKHLPRDSADQHKKIKTYVSTKLIKTIRDIECAPARNHIRETHG